MRFITRRKIYETIRNRQSLSRGMTRLLDSLAERFYESRFPMRVERLMAVERTAISPLYDFLAEPGETTSVSLSDRPSGEDTDMVVATFTNRSKNAVRIGVVRLPLKKMPDPKVSRMAALDVLSSL